LKMEKIRSLKSHSTKTWEDVLGVMADLALKELTKVRTPRATTTGSRAPTPATKNQLMREANYRCQHPGCDGTSFLQVDHIVPVARGGRTEMRNLRVLCAAHNLRKG
jgi:HNH endonuclease